MLLYMLLPWLILMGIYWFFWRRIWRSMGGPLGGRGVQDFLSGSAQRESRKGAKVTFADVAGQDNAKGEVAELVEFLRNRRAASSWWDLPVPARRCWHGRWPGRPECPFSVSRPLSSSRFS